ncbi:acyl-CoA dehydrogenase [Gordonia sp. SCSIO 19800]|uniref:acyl-CoA dehydrogenase n=1 Tax=Gordonia sp. SCSIO 19800 TaxID=2826926 RepID=UPI001B827D8B|nr:acyl-CoA dehydrogenase [Gordonia sp. SCSIO 19800]MBR7194400.1 acyl-CoA dehydrogenase [Gordonia sp. SCSIO 19800]
MGHYRSNLRDVEFNLFEVFGRDAVLGTGPFEEIDAETARMALREVEQLAREHLAESFEDSDRSPTVFDPVGNTVTVPAAYAATYKTWLDAEWWRLRLLPELGGTTAPSSLNWALAEFVLGAHPTLWTYLAFPTGTRVVWRRGTDRDKRIAEIVAANNWGVTMMLTEPEAGSDVGAGRTTATPNADGTWNLVGVKRFITAGEHDLADNILHLVLARPVGVEGAGGPGTKGLSLFLVPKHHFDIATGELTGERNGVYATGVEKKMGVKVSATCEMTLGADRPARGWLLGEVHDGINQMFDVLEDTRMMVGCKAIATLSTGYLNALEYAKTRVQGADLAQMSAPDAPRVPITAHPDVRRSLLVQKSYAEGLRSLVLYTATWQDEILMGTAAGVDTTLAEAVNDLLLPIVKGYGSERSWTILGTESLQTFGGSGYLQDHPIEQYVRDAKIDTVYEGTTAIQAQDLFFRKIVRNKGVAFGHLLEEIRGFASGPGRAVFADEAAMLTEAADAVGAIVARMTADLSAFNPRSEDPRPEGIYRVGLNATRLMFAMGDLLVAWLLLRGGVVASSALDSAPAGDERAFYEGKAGAARFFAGEVLPIVVAGARVAGAVDGSVMRLPVEAF